MVPVLGVFDHKEDAERCMRALEQRGFEARMLFEKIDDTNGRIDEIVGTIRLAGSVINTLPATGNNLVGNNSIIDTTYTELGDVMASDVIQNDARDGAPDDSVREASEPRVLVEVETSEERAEEVRGILYEGGATDVEVRKQQEGYVSD